jgi:hypothetical protein
MIPGVRGSCVAIIATVSSNGDTPVPAWCPEVGAPTTVVSATGAIEPLLLQEKWSVGGLTEGQEFVFPNAITADFESGLIAVSDSRLGSIAVINADGEWLGRISKLGRGPGEFLSPVAVEWAADSQLVVFDAGNAKVLRFVVDGTVIEERPVDAGFIGA